MLTMQKKKKKKKKKEKQKINNLINQSME